MKRFRTVRDLSNIESTFKCCACRRRLPVMARQVIEGKNTKRCKKCSLDMIKTCIRCGRDRRRTAFSYNGKKNQECQECHNSKHDSLDAIRAKRSAANANRRALNGGILTGSAVLARMMMTGGRCYICGTDKNIGIDHIKPLARGGANLPANIRACCRTCNGAKSDK